MSVLSGIARLLNPFAWLRSSKKVEQTAQHEYEFQEEEEPEPIEEAPSAQSLSESDVENHLAEGDSSDIHSNKTSDVHSDGCQEQMGGDVFLGTAKENEESSMESSDKVVSTQQGLFFGAPTSNGSPKEEVESRCGISDMTLEGSDKVLFAHFH
ncbi:hypothetical protein COOONC_02425 [Cooperia oncophora]